MLKIVKEDNQYRVELFQVNRLNTLFSELVSAQLRELVEHPGVSVVFNLKGVHFIDTAGFMVLKEISERAARNGSRFQLCNVSEEVIELIRLMELEEELSFCVCEHVKEKILMELD